MTMLTERQKDAWVAYWRGVGSEDWLTALALIELSPALLAEAAAWVASGRTPDGRDELLAWIRDVDDTGRGWSSTESRLFRVVAALVDPRPDLDWLDDGAALPPYVVRAGIDGPQRLIPLGSLADMGSWEGDVWRILTEWGTGGNTREQRGRYTATRTGP